MAKYKFPAQEIVGIMHHVISYDATVLAMTPDGTDYVMTLDKIIVAEQVEHLAEAYGLLEVAE